MNITIVLPGFPLNAPGNGCCRLIRTPRVGDMRFRSVFILCITPMVQNASCAIIGYSIVLAGRCCAENTFICAFIL